MKVSVIIPCRNEKRHIREFLDSVLAQELDPGWEMEVLVADGMSDDGTRDELARCPGVRVIDNPRRIVSTGLNAAIHVSTGEVVVRLDVHTTYAPDYIRRCIQALAETGSDNVGGPWVAEGRGPLGKAIAAAFQSPFCSGGGKAHDPRYEGAVDTVYLGCWRRSAFERFGLFDPGLVRNQDDEFNFRLRRMGGRIWQSPRIRSCYVPRASLGALFRQYLQYGFWRVAVIRKHRALASWRHAGPAIFVVSMLLCVAAAALALAARRPAMFSAAVAALGAGLSTYFLACVAAAIPCSRSLDLSSALMLPFVMGTYHVAYGLGFLLGIFKPRAARSRTAAPERLFTALTR